MLVIYYLLWMKDLKDDFIRRIRKKEDAYIYIFCIGNVCIMVPKGPSVEEAIPGWIRWTALDGPR